MIRINFLSRVIVISIALWINVLPIKAISNSTESDVWEVEIIKKKTNEVVVSQIVAINTFPINGLEENTEYFARVRTKNLVFSGWVTSGIFIYDSTTGIRQNNVDEKFVVRSEKGRLIVYSTIPQLINIYNINGYLIRSFTIVNRECVVVDGLEKGVYLANNRKVIVE